MTQYRFTESASRYRYDPHSYRNTELQLGSDAEVIEWAQSVLALRAYPNRRPLTVTVSVHADMPWAAATMDALLALDIGSPVTIRLTTRGPVQQWTAVVAGLQHSTTPETWETTITLALAEQASFGGYDSVSTRYDHARYEAAA